MPTVQITAVITIKLFPGTTILLKFLSFEGFINWNNTDGMVHNHLKSYNS